MAQIKRQIYNTLEGDSGLISKLADGVNSILPAVRSGVIYEPTSETATPFIVVKIEEQGAIDPPLIGRMGVSIWIYDEPGKSYWAVDRIIKEIREALENTGPQFTGDSGERIQDFMTEWEHTSGELHDDGLQKAYKYVRLGIWV